MTTAVMQATTRSSAVEAETQRVTKGHQRRIHGRGFGSDLVELPSDARDAVTRAINEPGDRLPESVRLPAEKRMGSDFSKVAVHTGPRADAAARAVRAKAFTVSSHIVFGAGRFAPENATGASLLTHELTHVAQQSRTGQPVLARDADDDPDAGVSLGWLDDSDVTSVGEAVLGETMWTIAVEFIRGLWGGLKSAGAAQWQKINEKFSDIGIWDIKDYAEGFVVGVLSGLWSGFTGLLDALWTLITLPYKINEFVFSTMPRLMVKFAARAQQLAAEADQIKVLLVQLMSAPAEAYQQIRGLIVAVAKTKIRQVGRWAATRILAFLGAPWYEFGRSVGNVAGQILFEVLLIVGTGAIANAVKAAGRIAAMVAKAGTKVVELLRGAGRLIGEVFDLAQAIGRKLAGKAGELFEAFKKLLAKLRTLFAEMLEESALADTGAGGVRMPVPDPKGPTVLEMRAQPPKRNVADLKPPKVHPSKTPTKTPPKSPKQPSRFTKEEIAEDVAEEQLKGWQAAAEEAPTAHGMRVVDPKVQRGQLVPKPGGRRIPVKFERGQFAHEYAELLIPESQLPRNLAREVTVELPGGKVRLDRVDFTNGVYYEIKPATSGSVAAGEAQIRRYAEYMNRNFPLPGGRRWEGGVVTYGTNDAIALFGM